MADREKEGKRETQKSEYLENENSFLDKIKSIFHSFLGLPFDEKQKFNKK